MEKLKFGLVGYGKVAELHARAIAASGNCELVSVWGRDPERREAFASKHSIKARSSIAEMVDKDKVEAVLIVTPHPTHKVLAVEAAQGIVQTGLGDRPVDELASHGLEPEESENEVQAAPDRDERVVDQGGQRGHGVVGLALGDLP